MGVAAPSGKRQGGMIRWILSLGAYLKGFAHDLVHGDWFTKLTLLIWGAGYMRRGQYIKGLLLTALEGVLVWLVGFQLMPYLLKFDTLGTVAQERVWNDAAGKYDFNQYDNSFLILLFSVIGLFLIVFAVVFCIRNVRQAYEVEQRVKAGKKINSFRNDIEDVFGKKFHRTLLSLPILGVLTFTIIPLLVTVLVAFTNYDSGHTVPKNLFTWVGMENFAKVFDLSNNSRFASAFGQILIWTIVWSFLATFTCYIGGILLAMFINNKRTIGKKFWRTCFMVAVAVPQFVSLMLIRNFFHDDGVVNVICRQMGITKWLFDMGVINKETFIPFLTDVRWVRPMIILINMWVGVPFTMLMVSGILMNIPGELLESAKIDGANAWQSFKSITMPYILFITGPYLINTLVSNINNFNVIYLLTREVYGTRNMELAAVSASETDLLITWLYKLTTDQESYNMASVIGIIVFLICAAATLLSFNRMIKGDKEETFQ